MNPVKKAALSFSLKLHAKVGTSLRTHKKVLDQISRLWRECVVSTYLNKGTWTIEDYMNCASSFPSPSSSRGMRLPPMRSHARSTIHASI